MHRWMQGDPKVLPTDMAIFFVDPPVEVLIVWVKMEINGGSKPIR